MSESRAAGWPSGAPTAAQLKEFFSQIDRGAVTKKNLQSFLLRKPAPIEGPSFPIEELNIGVRVYECLKRIGVELVSDLTDKTADELLSIPYFGSQSLAEVENALVPYGLALKGGTRSSATPNQVDLSMFMQQVIERVGREPNSINDRIYYWKQGDTDIELIVSNRQADVEVHLHVNRFSPNPEETSYHHYELTDVPEWDGMSAGPEGSTWTYRALVETVGHAVATTLNFAA